MANFDALNAKINTIVFEFLAKGDPIKIDLIGTLVTKNCFTKGSKSEMKKVVTLENKFEENNLMDLIEPFAKEEGLNTKDVFDQWYASCLIGNSDNTVCFEIKNTVTIVINKSSKTVEITASEDIQKYLNPMNTPVCSKEKTTEKPKEMKGKPKEIKEKSTKAPTENNKMPLKHALIIAGIVFFVSMVGIFFDDIFHKSDTLPVATQVEKQKNVEAKEVAKTEVAAKINKKAKEVEKQPTKPIVKVVDGQIPANTPFLVFGVFEKESNAKKLKSSLNFENKPVHIYRKGNLNFVMIELSEANKLTAQERQIKNNNEGSWYFINK